MPETESRGLALASPRRTRDTRESTAATLAGGAEEAPHVFRGLAGEKALVAVRRAQRAADEGDQLEIGEARFPGREGQHDDADRLPVVGLAARNPVRIDERHRADDAGDCVRASVRKRNAVLESRSERRLAL